MLLLQADNARMQAKMQRHFVIMNACLASIDVITVLGPGMQHRHDARGQSRLVNWLCGVCNSLELAASLHWQMAQVH